MRTFNDALGRDWTLDLNIATARTIRQKTRTVESLKHVDFLDYAVLLTSLGDVFFAADLLFVVCEDQAAERNVSADEFGRALKGKFLFDAIAALTAEYLDFFPDPETTEKMRRLVEKLRETNALICDAVCEKTTETIDEILADAETKFGISCSDASRSEPPELSPPSPI